MNGITRRDTFAAVGAGSLGLMSFVGSASAADMTATEKANVDLISAMLKTWGDQNAKGAAFEPFLADNAMIRMDEGKPAITKAAAIAAIDGYFARGLRFDIKMETVFAKGPIVATWRKEIIVDHGKPGAALEAIGVYVVRNGKIEEWSDYLVPRPT